LFISPEKVHNLAETMTDFVKTYLTVANTQDALKCTPEFVAELRQRLLTDAPELENIAFPLLVSL
jgi:hypothetical protein